MTSENNPRNKMPLPFFLEPLTVHKALFTIHPSFLHVPTPRKQPHGKAGLILGSCKLVCLVFWLQPLNCYMKLLLVFLGNSILLCLCPSAHSASHQLLKEELGIGWGWPRSWHANEHPKIWILIIPYNLQLGQNIPNMTSQHCQK